MTRAISYRNVDAALGVPELDAPSFQAKVVNRKFAGLEAATRVAAVEIPPNMAPGDVVAHLRATEGFGPYADMLAGHGMLRGENRADGRRFRKLKYVFTKPEGAIANLETLAEVLRDGDFKGGISVEVFDKSGRMHAARTPDQMLAILHMLRGAK
ncbi:MAG: hypothetical protein R3B06_09265 [Kofleriaceae bacterium]